MSHWTQATPGCLHCDIWQAIKQHYEDKGVDGYMANDVIMSLVGVLVEVCLDIQQHHGGTYEQFKESVVERLDEFMKFRRTIQSNQGALRVN